MSYRLLSGLVNQIREIIDVEFGVLDSKGALIASSIGVAVGSEFGPAKKALQAAGDIAIVEPYAIKKIYLKNKLECMVYIKGTDAVSQNYLQLIGAYVAGIKNCHDEKLDRSSFIKDLLEEAIRPSDIISRARELRIPVSVPRVVFAVKSAKAEDALVAEVLRELFPVKSRDFIVTMDDKTTVLVKELKGQEDYQEAERIANMIADALNSETLIRASVGIGSIVRGIGDIGRSCREACTALDIGSVFESNKTVIAFNRLGISRLIHQLPPQVCRMFLDEIFKGGSYEVIEGEYLATIQKFFENNLNISEASRQMFVHRNTLVYRLEKIQKLTGLNLTSFDDAVILKLAILVRKHLEKTGAGNS